MTVLLSGGRLTSVKLPQLLDPSGFSSGHSASSVALFAGSVDYARLWRSQPNVRLCTEFLARNMAQLGIHVYDRVSDVDRQRLADHPIAAKLKHPNPYMTRYRLVENLMMSMGIYFEAFWMKVRLPAGDIFLQPLSPVNVTVHGGLWPTYYEIEYASQKWNVPPEDIVHFRGYNPDSPLWAVSPLETLRRVLAEEAASTQYRADYWQKGARVGQVIERPVDAPEWTNEARLRFQESFRAAYTAQGPDVAGFAVLEDGMKLGNGSFSPSDSEYVEGRKLSREECARAYHIPLPMVGILDHATYSNVKEQHKHLYQDTLGPWCAMIEQELELQLLPEYEDIETTSVYLEFNIAEKLKGTPEEQMDILTKAAGGPILLTDEARAFINKNELPQGEGQTLRTPVNMVPKDEADQLPAPKAELKAAERTGARREFVKAWRNVVQAHFDRQRRALGLLADRKAASFAEFDDALRDDEWNKSLTRDFLALNWATAKAYGDRLAKKHGLDWQPEVMMNWLRLDAENSAKKINQTTADSLPKAWPAGVLDPALLGVVWGAENRADQIAHTKTTRALNFGEHDAARHGGLTHKTWRTTSSKPRPSHGSQSGVTVGIDEAFPNGLRFPSDPRGSAEETAGCECRLDYSATPPAKSHVDHFFEHSSKMLEVVAALAAKPDPKPQRINVIKDEDGNITGYERV